MNEPGDPRKKRRKVVKLNPIDAERMRSGLAPSWLEPADVSSDDRPDPNEDSNDQRLQADRPPHWSPPA